MDAPPPQPQSECLICFGPIRRNVAAWRQPTPIQCECRPLIHRACWDAWAAQAGPVCIICRSNKYYPVPPQPPYHIRRGIRFLGYDMDPCTAALTIFFIVYLALIVFNSLQGKPTYTETPGSYDRYPPRRLEL